LTAICRVIQVLGSFGSTKLATNQLPVPVQRLSLALEYFEAGQIGAAEADRHAVLVAGLVDVCRRGQPDPGLLGRLDDQPVGAGRRPGELGQAGLDVGTRGRRRHEGARSGGCDSGE
jgi:hypothetical protein